MIAIETAAQLIDFRGRVGERTATDQLHGAVALHNILERHRVAYLADEVGMGKTYVALGVVALFRHFHPNFRVLVIAPRENIQRKWVKELKNFVANNFLVADFRVRAINRTPAREPVVCANLHELVRETALNPDRDFFARLSSFSLPLGNDSQGWRAKREALLRELPWLDRELLPLRNKDEFKDNYARAVCCALPAFDLVIVDEAQNLKHGLREGGAFRNRILSLCFGHLRGRSAGGRLEGYRPKARRVLFLSATPIENDYLQLWNQLDVFGFGSVAPELARRDLQDAEKKSCAQEFLIRRVTSLAVNGERLTKNLYRREWRGGGVAQHDEPLPVPGEPERLLVALVQKKVAEVLGSERFNNSFQIGMLASFESFMETAGVKARAAADQNGEEVQVFDDAEQTVDPNERAGADVVSINHLARSYRRRFGTELPHPKMEALVDRLKAAFESGDKALVFVRRIASVKELQRKLELRYDEWILDRLERELPASVMSRFARIIAEYRETQQRRSVRNRPSTEIRGTGEDGAREAEEILTDADEGGTETFFAWFFRGDGPANVLSGALMQKRFSGTGSVYSTFFEDNHVAWLLGVRPGEVGQALQEYIGSGKDELRDELGRKAALLLPAVKKQQRRNLFLAVQNAAVRLIADRNGPLQERAETVWQERYFEQPTVARAAGEKLDASPWLERDTFWTALRRRGDLRRVLWPEPSNGDFCLRFREMELRRELFSAMTRLGNPFVDLYILAVRRVGRLELRAREDDITGELTEELLDLLQRQMADGADRFTSFVELAAAAGNFDLILDVNIPEARTAPLANAATEFGRLLRKQQPVGGMFGAINQTLVRQFRMPGYPLVLITTDLLQEGEDLHTFCSSVYHYGISWMPSAMEQRVGRIDRVGCKAERQLMRLGRTPNGDEKLQVYYPHLRDTVEVLQVERVFERMDRFLRLMHEQLGDSEGHRRHIDVNTDILRARRAIQEIQEPLETSFPVRDEQLQGEIRPPAVEPHVAEAIRMRFQALRPELSGTMRVRWRERAPHGALIGSAQLASGREQAFRLELRSLAGWPIVRCVSPIGQMPAGANPRRIADLVRSRPVQLLAIPDARYRTYDLAVDGEVLLGKETCDAVRVGNLVQRVVEEADAIEEELLGIDTPFAEAWEQLAGADDNVA